MNRQQFLTFLVCVCVCCECLKMSSNVMILVLESEVRKEEVMMAGANRVKNKPFFRREVTVSVRFVRPSVRIELA